jgi:hypothetical protein
VNKVDEWDQRLREASKKEFFVRPLKAWREDRAGWESKMKFSAEEAARAEGLEGLLLLQLKCLEDFRENAAVVVLVYQCREKEGLVVAPAGARPS